jgi:hypothetical protein
MDADHSTASKVQFYNAWEGLDWYPIDADDGSKEQPLDLEFWQYCKDQGDTSGESYADAIAGEPDILCTTLTNTATEDPQIFNCTLCIETMYMPVL